MVARAAAALPAWAATPPADRARALHAVAVALEDARADLVATMVHEAGKTVAEADPEVSEAVDFARYYADRAADLADGVVPGAVHRPAGLTVVTPPWNFPVAIPVGSVLASLAAGSPVLVKPAPADAAVRAGRDGGDPARARRGRRARGVLTVVLSPEGDVGRRLVTHPDVARVVLTGSIETARLFAGWRPDLDVLAETSGKNALVITPSADVDLAVADLVRSAFGHAGQKCSAASLAILVGSAGRSDRLRRQLADAVASLRVGPATDLGTAVGPLTEPASRQAAARADHARPGGVVAGRSRGSSTTRAGCGRPGVKYGVAPGSWFHTTECFGPVLGIMRVETLDEAIDLQNAVAFGLTGGLHSLDEAEIDHWLDRVEVGNAYVNRHITGAIVQRQPFGGWKASDRRPRRQGRAARTTSRRSATWQDCARRPAGRRRLARLGRGRRRPRVGRRALASSTTRPGCASRRTSCATDPCPQLVRPGRVGRAATATSTASGTPRATAGVPRDRERRSQRVPRGVRRPGPRGRGHRPGAGGRVGARAARGGGHPRRRGHRARRTGAGQRRAGAAHRRARAGREPHAAPLRPRARQRA